MDIPDEVEHREAPSGVRVWRRYCRYAAAAMIVLCVGVFWVYSPGDPSRRFRVEESAGVSASPPHTVRTEVEEAAEERLSAPAPSQPGSVVADAGPEAASEATKRNGDQRLAGPSRPRLGSISMPPLRPDGHSHHSLIEAALCEGPHCLYRAYVLPDVRERLIGIGPAFDTSSPVGFTTEPAKVLDEE